jgi:hypothetical protein
MVADHLELGPKKLYLRIRILQIALDRILMLQYWDEERGGEALLHAPFFSFEAVDCVS